MEHLNTLEAELNSLVCRKRYTISNYVNLETRQQIWELVNEPPVIPDTIPLLLGDCLYNFRAALDHLVWQLVILEGNTPCKKNEFPIFDNPAQYKVGKKPRLQGLSADAIVIIDGLQPHNAGNEALSMLYELNNTDKHRHLHFAVSAVTIQQLNVTLRTDGIGSDFLSTAQSRQGSKGHFGPIEKGTILYSALNPYVDAKVNPIIDIIFRDFEAELRVSVGDVIRSIRDMVNKVFSQLSPLFIGDDTKKE